MKYTATDGTVFTDRALYKRHEMELQYTIRGKSNINLTKNPGSVNGQPFDIIDCKNCSISIYDHCDQVQIDDVVDSNIFIGASCGSVFVRNCSNCIFTIACKQLRTRDCKECSMNLHCMTQPVIETSSGMKFGQLYVKDADHEKAIANAGLDLSVNQWSKVYDFNDPSKTGENWSIVKVHPVGITECDTASGITTSRRLFASPIKLDPSKEAALSGDEDMHLNHSQPFLPEEKGTNRFMLFGQRLWGIMSYSISAARAFCLGLILNSIDSGRRLLSWSD